MTDRPLFEARSAPVLYRLFGEDGELLYVGQTGNLHRRIAQHQRNQPWWDEVCDMTVEHMPGPPAGRAQAAERDAIRTERPRYNIAHRVES